MAWKPLLWNRDTVHVQFTHPHPICARDGPGHVPDRDGLPLPGQKLLSVIWTVGEVTHTS